MDQDSAVTFNDPGHGIQNIIGSKTFRHDAQGVDDRRRKHEQLNGYWNNETDVAVENIHGREQKDQPDDEKALNQKHRQDEKRDSTERDAVIPQERNKQDHAHSEIDHRRTDNRKRNQLARKINL